MCKFYKDSKLIRLTLSTRREVSFRSWRSRITNSSRCIIKSLCLKMHLNMPLSNNSIKVTQISKQFYVLILNRAHVKTDTIVDMLTANPN